MNDEMKAKIEAEARRIHPENHEVDDPFGETGTAWSDPYGYEDTARQGFFEGASWALDQTDVKNTQWYAYWEGIHQAVQHWANGTPMNCPYPTPPQATSDNWAHLTQEERDDLNGSQI